MKALLVAGGIAAALLVLGSCSKKLTRAVVPNHEPEVRISATVIPAREKGTPQYLLRWSGTDPDGRIDHYLLAVDPASVDRVDGSWVSTRETQRVLGFPRLEKESSAREPHVIAVRAVDNRGAVSAVSTAAVAEENLPPYVVITNPQPSSLLVPTVPPNIRITWTGIDPDPVLSPKPVKYKWILLGPGSQFPIDVAVQNPDSLRRFYAPEFAGWDSTGKDSTSVFITNLIPDNEYLFVVVAFDELGDYSPVFSLNSNMLRFRVGFAGSLGPLLTFYNEFFSYRYRSPSYCPCPSTEIPLEVPAGRPVTINWFATPPAGADIRGYKWALDIEDVSDETPRTDELTDLRHWSARSAVATSATLGPFGPGEIHRLYVDVEDTYGLRSLGIVRLSTISLGFQRNVLIVDDTRLKPDGFDGATGCTTRPIGRWPTAAELDSFLYARGGVPWRCYPAGTLSQPGLFSGYPFDTVGTRGLVGGVPLSTLGAYRHVVWIVDAVGASYVNPDNDPVQPMTALRSMTAPGAVNTLAQYIEGGGRVWLVGGGCAYASLINWDDPANNLPTTTFSSLSPRGELVPGRMMYDEAAWRSEIRVSTEPAVIRRFRGRLEGTGQYAGLPAAMEFKTTVSDPMPPNRTNPADFYRTVANLEYLQRDNDIVEGGVSTLDSLFDAAGGTLFPPSVNPHNVVMSYYHGPGVVFTGFDIWTFKRSQCAQLVDFVLHDLWGLNRSTVTSTPPPSGGLGRGGGPVSRTGEH